MFQMSMSRTQTRPEQAELEGLQVWSIVRGPSSWGVRGHGRLTTETAAHTDRC